MPALYQTAKVYEYATNTAGQTVDFELASELGPAAACLLQSVGADRTAQVYGSSAAATALLTLKDGQAYVIDARTTKVIFASGTSATLRCTALYADRWQ
jgi:hypothetical protein